MFFEIHATRSHYYLQSGNIFLTINLITSDFITLFDLNLNPNNLVEVLFLFIF